MFTLNVDLFFSIPIPGFISSDRFAWNSPVRLPLISSVLLLLGKTKSFVFPSKRRTHWPAELLTSQKNFTLHFRQTPGRSEKSKIPLARAPMVTEHKYLRLMLALHGKRTATLKIWTPTKQIFSEPPHIKILLVNQCFIKIRLGNSGIPAPIGACPFIQ